ncbi:YgjP-like metallopeptidase domain-containing protein [Arenimonas sp.]|uniref:YgjP-like metallopeptidase domain-containing protein n=1 Tax=Arenimonas sp. TaxID=1872635 RepID=UPI0025DE3931|nr:YgjP-like metallopeptidase domain-containing protein [Arenimonas sp.]
MLPTPEIRPLALADGREVPVRWVRDRRARRLRLIVSDKGARLTLPLVASVRGAEAFLHEHRDWLAAQLARQRHDDAPRFGRDWTGPLPLRGQDVPVQWREGRYARAALGEHGIELQLPAGADDARARAALRCASSTCSRPAPTSAPGCRATCPACRARRWPCASAR